MLGLDSHPSWDLTPWLYRTAVSINEVRDGSGGSGISGSSLAVGPSVLGALTHTIAPHKQDPLVDEALQASWGSALAS